MERMQDYIVKSLEQHLFFARIMKEHAFFLKVGFLPVHANMAREGENLLRQFESILSRAISLSDEVVRSSVLESGELCTEFTHEVEHQTERLTGTRINHDLTRRVGRLSGRDCDVDFYASDNLTRQVRQLNRDALRHVDRLINYKERILNEVDAGRMFTVNYPLLIEHILREARLYRAYIRQLEELDDCDCKEIRDSELFWNRIMMEHALFIRGLLDPSEEELIETADDFAQKYKCLLERASVANDRVMCRNRNRNNDSDNCDVLELTCDFRDFKSAGTEGIKECKIDSIILPLLADHVLREANHYIRLLED